MMVTKGGWPDPTCFVVACSACGEVEVYGYDGIDHVDHENRAIDLGGKALAEWGCLHNPADYTCRPKWQKVLIPKPPQAE